MLAISSLLTIALTVSVTYTYTCTAYPNHYGSLCFSKEILKGTKDTCIRYHVSPNKDQKLYCQALGLSKSKDQSESIWGLIDLGVVNNLNLKLGWGERTDYPAIWCYSNDGSTDFDWTWTLRNGRTCEEDENVYLIAQKSI